MARQFTIAGQSMVQVVGPTGTSSIAGTCGTNPSGGKQLGLSSDAIRVIVQVHSEPLIVDAYGKDNPVDEQVFGGEATIIMNLIHFDPLVLTECVRLSFPGSAGEGLLGAPGRTRGQGLALGVAGNNYITLNITSPAANNPIYPAWNFPAAYLRDEPVTFPVGAEKSVVRLIWKALAYSADPWNGGTASQNVPLYNHVALASPPNPT